TPERIRIRHPLVRGLVRRTRPLRAVSRRSAPGAGANVRREVVTATVGTIEELLAEAAGALAPSLQGEHVLASAPAAGHPFVAAALAVATGAPVLAVAPDPRSAQTLADGAAAWLGGERAVLFPAWESLPYEGISPGPLTAGRRAAAANRVRQATGPMVVAAPVLAALQRVSPE